MRTVFQNVRKVGGKAGLNVVFSAPVRLSGLCKKLNEKENETCPCKIKHRDPYVTCTERIVYSIPLNSNKMYIGQTGKRGLKSTTIRAQLKIRHILPFIAEITAARPRSRKQS